MPVIDAKLAGDLLRLALEPKANPSEDADYRRGLEAYLSDPVFRDHIRLLADGLGLIIVAASERGLVLAPAPESPFELRSRDLRPGSRQVHDRMIDGLVLLAIAAACYPRADDLDQDPVNVRPPVTVSLVERLLRDATQRVAARAAGPDVTAEERAAMLEPAWRLVMRTPDVRDTTDGRAGARTSRGRIKALLERLEELGAFQRTTARGEAAWRPTYRWQVQVQQLAAGELWAEAKTILGVPLPSSQETD